MIYKILFASYILLIRRKRVKQWDGC